MTSAEIYKTGCVTTFCDSHSILDVTLHLYKRSCLFVRSSVRPSVRISVRPSLPTTQFSRATNMAVFKSEKSSIDIINDGKICDDNAALSGVSPRYLFVSLPIDFGLW